jgi:L-seryl-tRNA(Ser) seleniumtransferase
MGLYEELGIRKVINASGTMTHLGGSIPDPRVMDAMKEASQSFVVMMELIERSGKVVAKVTGAEAGLITSGSSAAMVLGAAACIMKGCELEKFEARPFERLNFDQDWRDVMQKLPDTSWARNEIIIQRAHRNAYDHAYKVAGGKLVVVGTSEGCSPVELEGAISERTAAIAFTGNNEDIGVPLRKVVEIARRHNVPVIVDAAAELPPRSNLKRYISEGADLVVFSGGKHIGGPNATGILCGRRDLIKLATLQSAPYRGIGRGMKVDRASIVGMMTALRIWLEKDEKAEFEGWKEKARWIADELKGTKGVANSEIVIDKRGRYVQAHVTLKRGDSATANAVLNLRKGNPSVWVNYISPNKIGVEPSLLRDGEEKILVSALKRAISEES